MSAEKFTDRSLNISTPQAQWEYTLVEKPKLFVGKTVHLNEMTLHFFIYSEWRRASAVAMSFPSAFLLEGSPDFREWNLSRSSERFNASKNWRSSKNGTRLLCLVVTIAWETMHLWLIFSCNRKHFMMEEKEPRVNILLSTIKIDINAFVWHWNVLSTLINIKHVKYFFENFLILFWGKTNIFKCYVAIRTKR